MVPANEEAPVGIVATPTLDDLAAIMPDVAHSLHEVLDYKGNFQSFEFTMLFGGQYFRLSTVKDNKND